MAPAVINAVREEKFESVGGIKIHLRSWPTATPHFGDHGLAHGGLHV